jgi:hypothetical protein
LVLLAVGRELGKAARLEVASRRSVFAGILWYLADDRLTWRDLPTDRFGPRSTCFKWYRRWIDGGLLRLVLETMAEDLEYKETEVGSSEPWMDETRRLLASARAREISSPQ